jgi:two-component system, cell cycle response regulator DivK
MPVPERPNDAFLTDDSSAVSGLTPQASLQGSRELMSGSNGRPNILIADDDDDTRAMLRTLLEMKGYLITEARDGQETIEKTVQESPGMVLLDLGLPVLNGLTVIRRLREDYKMIDVPLVVVTGFDKHVETAMAAGCVDYLMKPIDFDRLDNLLDLYVPTKARAAGL